MSDELLELIEDVVDRVTYEHDALDNDSRCRCGVVNNMDGDVLHSHRVGAMVEAIEAVLVPASAHPIKEQGAQA